MNILSKLSETLNELMTLNELNEKSLAEKSGIPLSCISVYARGKQAPYVDTIIKLADYFNCSVDYLLGRTDELKRKPCSNCIPFVKRFNELLIKNNCTSYKSFEQTEIKKSSFYAWKCGESLPTLDNLVELADYFNCSVEYLLGREN